MWEANPAEAQREVGETRLLTKEEFVGKVAVSTNAQPRAPRRVDELRGAVIADRRTYDLSVPWWGAETRRKGAGILWQMMTQSAPRPISSHPNRTPTSRTSGTGWSVHGRCPEAHKEGSASSGWKAASSSSNVLISSSMARGPRA